MRDFDVFVTPNFCFNNAKTVILTRYFAAICQQIQHRVIDAAMPVVHFIGRNSDGFCQKLLPQTNAKNRFSSRLHDTFHGLDGILHRRRVARTVT